MTSESQESAALSSLSVTTLKGVEDAVDVIFSKALKQKKFGSAYADLCIKLEEYIGNGKLEMMTTLSFGGLIYSLLEAVPPHRVTGPFASKEMAWGQSIEPQQEAPSGLKDCGLTIVEAKVFRLWQNEQEKYYTSRPVVANGPFRTTAEAHQAFDQVHPIRLVLLQRCQKELEASTTGKSPMDIEKMKQIKFGTCCFLGALYRRGLVEASAIHSCIETLLDVRRNIAGDIEFLHPSLKPNEINFDVLCSLLEAVGALLESPGKDPLVSKYFWLLRSKIPVVGRKLASRMESVITLRAKGWNFKTVEMEKACVEISRVLGRKRERTE